MGWRTDATSPGKKHLSASTQKGGTHFGPMHRERARGFRLFVRFMVNIFFTMKSRKVMKEEKRPFGFFCFDCDCWVSFRRS